MITAYVKLSEFCSVGCDHCYLPEKLRNDKTVISDKDIVECARHISELAAVNSTNKVMLIVHGGEPLSLSRELLTKKLNLLTTELKARGLYFKETVQSSIIPLNKNWIPTIKERWDSFVGFSVDFSSRQISGSNEKYLRLLEKRLCLLRDNEIDYGATIVPSVKELGREREIVDWFAKEKVKTVNIDRYTDFGSHDPLRPTNRQYSEFLINLLDDVIKRLSNDEFTPVFFLMQSAIIGVAFGRKGERWGTGCLGDQLIFGVGGKINSCPDKFAHEKSYVENDTFILSDARMNAIYDYKLNHKNIYCDNCKYNSWCQTGCPVVSNNIISEGDCSGYKLFLNYLETHLKNPKTHELLVRYALNEAI